jgi:hypothetical protein
MKVYIGFSVDMDRAYCNCNAHGQFIPKTHPEHKNILAQKQNFIKYTNKLITYFEKNKYNQSVTWFVNEADYTISVFHNEILKRCSDSGELGLHTHLNSGKFNAEAFNMSENRNDWEQVGIKDANANINAFINYNNFIYKAGNHIRNDVLFDTLADNLFSIDTTMDINNKNFENDKMYYDDTNIPIGTEPFLINCKNKGVILEIPEIRVHKIIDHIKACETNNNLCFIKIQIHHWQYDELIPEFDRIIQQIQNLQYEIEFIDLRQMQKLFFEKKKTILDERIRNCIKAKIPNDEYYISLKQSIGTEFLELSLWLFNFCDKRNKIIELFAGIGQCSIFLHDLGFNNLTISDYDDKRCNFYKEIDNYKNITPLVSDFYDVDINEYDVCFFGNSINSSLCDRLNIQVKKYQDFIDQDKLLIIHSKYGSGIKEFNYLLDNLKKYSIIKQIGDYFVIKKTNDDVQIIPYSTQFKMYKTIGFSNVEHDVICENNQQFIKISFKDPIMASAGIFFPINYAYRDLTEQLYRCKLKFDVRIETINENSKIKIYTGIKWITLDNQLTKEYQTIEFEDDFDFFKLSAYRIGFVNMENNELYFKNCCIEKYSS